MGLHPRIVGERYKVHPIMTMNSPKLGTFMVLWAWLGDSDLLYPQGGKFLANDNHKEAQQQKKNEEFAAIKIGGTEIGNVRIRFRRLTPHSWVGL